MPQSQTSLFSSTEQDDLLKRCGIADPVVFDRRVESPRFVDAYVDALHLGLEPTFLKQTKQTPVSIDGHLRFVGAISYAGVITFDSGTHLYTLFANRGVKRAPPRAVARSGNVVPALDSNEVHQICSLPTGVVYQLAQQEPFFDAVFRYACRHAFQVVGIRPMRPHPKVGLLTENAYVRLENKGVVGVITSEGTMPYYRFYAPV